MDVASAWEFVRENYWFLLSGAFFAIRITATLGERVFRWWEEPGEFWTAAGLGLGVFTLASGANRRDVLGLHRSFNLPEAAQERLIPEHERLVEALREQTGLLDEVAGFFRRREQRGGPGPAPAASVEPRLTAPARPSAALPRARAARRASRAGCSRGGSAPRG